jgi:hypothetical protein
VFNTFSISGAVFRGLRAVKRLTAPLPAANPFCGTPAVEAIE